MEVDYPPFPNLLQLATLSFTRRLLMRTDPWTVYWQGDHLESCIASISQQDAKQIALLWEELASQLSDASRV